MQIRSDPDPDLDPDPDHKMFMFTKEMAYKNISLQNIKKHLREIRIRVWIQIRIRIFETGCMDCNPGLNKIGPDALTEKNTSVPMSKNIIIHDFHVLYVTYPCTS